VSINRLLSEDSLTGESGGFRGQAGLSAGSG